MTPYRYGDVVLVNFPFTNLSTVKKRPAVVISSDAYNARRPDVILIGVTSQVRQPLALGEALLKDWQKAGLLKTSMIRPLIATVQRNSIERNLGRLSPSDIGVLKTVMKAILVI